MAKNEDVVANCFVFVMVLYEGLGVIMFCIFGKLKVG